MKRNEIINNKKCQFRGCESPARNLCRTYFLCDKHSRIIKIDNKIKLKEGIKITKDLNILKITKSKVTI